MSERAEGKKLDIRLPDLGEVAETVIVEWLKNPGDLVDEGEDLVEVETEKTTFVVASPAPGRVTQIFLTAGERAQVGDLLGEIEQI